MFTDRRTVVLLLALAALAAEKKAERLDCYGDPLPQGALARMGTVRGRLPGLVTCCAFSRDGKILVAAGGDAAIHLFDAETGRPLRELHHHKKDVTCLAFSPDGKMLASGSEDGTLCLWDWPAGKVLRQFPAHKEGVRVLAFAGTGKFLASGGKDKRICLWDPATGRELRHLSGHKDVVTAVAVSPDGRFVASGERSDPVRLWDAASGRLLHQNQAGALWVQSLAFSPDSKLVALSVDFLKIGLWDVATGKIVRRLNGQLSGSISSVAISPDGRSVAAAATNRSLVLWDAATGKILHQLRGSNYIRQPGGITCLAFSPDGRRLAFGEDHCLRVWNLGDWREVRPVEGHANCIYRVLFSRDIKTLVTAADEVADALQEWDASTGKKLRTLYHQHLMGRHGFHLSPDHRVLTITDTEEKSLLLCSRNTATGKEIRRVKMPFDHQWGYNAATIILSPDGKIITSESWDGSGNAGPLLLRDATTGKVLGKLFSSYAQFLRSPFLFSPDSGTLVSDERNRIDLYNVARGQIVRQLPLADENEYVRCRTFSRDSRVVVAAISNSDEPSPGRLVVWETTTGQKRATMKTAPNALAELAFSPDGALLAAGDDDGVIHLWSVAVGKEVRKLQGHRGGVESLAFSHDGKLLASGSWDTTALIWDMREAAEAARPHPTDVPRDRLERLWADLAGNDGSRAHRAIWDLVAARQVMPWLREHLKPVPKADEMRIARLIADLDSDTFAVREKATHDLEAMAESAEPALRKVLAGKPSLELRRRVEPIVNNLDNWPATSSASLRDWRALEVLEQLDTPEARQLLQKLTDGVPEARLTREAKATLQRLAGRRVTMP